MKILYHRLGHAKDPFMLRIGDRVVKGQVLGKIGKTGAANGEHLHYDILKIKQDKFTSYTLGMSRAQVAATYLDPSGYIKDGLPADDSLPRVGFRYLQWTGRLYHPGRDINSPNDAGKSFASSVDGAVVFTARASDPASDGWGNVIVIAEEVKEYDSALFNRLKGKILVKPEDHGKAYIVTEKGTEYLGTTFYEYIAFMDRLRSGKIPHLGISNIDFDKLPRND